jgi:outer membrane protein OmpA-like peptidoglycan-associated protein
MNADSREPLAAQIMTIDTRTGKDTTIVESNAGDGRYIIILNAGQTYDVAVTAEGYTFYSTHFDLSGLVTYQSVQKDILLERIAPGAMITLNNIYFEFGKYRLLDESRYELNRVIDLMNDYPDMTVEIAGHTDSIASKAYNLELSDKRAGAVVSYLASHGIDAGRLRSHGYGEMQPVADNGTDEGRQKNRRVEFRVLSVTPKP